MKDSQGNKVYGMDGPKGDIVADYAPVKMSVTVTKGSKSMSGKAVK
jgi:hypothetical protein